MEIKIIFISITVCVVGLVAITIRTTTAATTTTCKNRSPKL
jgi:hypothetical protein